MTAREVRSDHHVLHVYRIPLAETGPRPEVCEYELTRGEPGLRLRCRLHGQIGEWPWPTTTTWSDIDAVLEAWAIHTGRHTTEQLESLDWDVFHPGDCGRRDGWCQVEDWLTEIGPEGFGPGMYRVQWWFTPSGWAGTKPVDADAGLEEVGAPDDWWEEWKPASARWDPHPTWTALVDRLWREAHPTVLNIGTVGDEF